MDFSIHSITTLSSLLLTGLAAGLCFTWANAVTPGIGRLSDLNYLQAFQEMNRAIINPLFLIVFFGPFLSHAVHLFFYWNEPGPIKGILLLAAISYLAGVLFVTIFGNVPLNEILERTDLQKATSSELKALRLSFEAKWNAYHQIRTAGSLLSFILLILAILLD